jgi:hypothetical protein
MTTKCRRFGGFARSAPMVRGELGIRPPDWLRRGGHDLCHWLQVCSPQVQYLPGSAGRFGEYADRCTRSLSVRWAEILLANDLLRGGHVFPEELPQHGDGWGP